MAEKRGRVIDVADGFVRLEIPRDTACGHCSVNSTCGTGAIGSWLGRRPLRLTLKNTLSLSPGDLVVVSFPDQDVLGASVLAYLVPLVGLFAGGLAGDFISQRLQSDTELLTIFGAAAGVAAALFWLRVRKTSDTAMGVRLLRKEPMAPTVVTLS